MASVVLPHRLAGTPYRLDALIGEGGMGEVFLGEHVELRRRLGVKLIKRCYASDEQVCGRMRREARIVSRLFHQSLVQIYDLGTTLDGRTFIAMEYLEGEVLRSILAKRGALPAYDATLLMAMALEGLAVTHQASVIHRDVKPENLFLTRDGQLKILDFGVAKPLMASDLTGIMTAAGQVLGTPRYMAPEQATGGTLCPATDVYAVGCVLFELLTGTPLAIGSDSAQLLHHHLVVPAPSLSSRTGRPFDPELESIVARALDKNPRRRFASAGEMAAWLRSIAARLPRSDAPGAIGSHYGAPQWSTADQVCAPTVRLSSPSQHEPHGGPQPSHGVASAPTMRSPAVGLDKTLPTEVLPALAGPVSAAARASLMDSRALAPTELSPRTRARSSRWALGIAGLIPAALGTVLLLQASSRMSSAIFGGRRTDSNSTTENYAKVARPGTTSVGNEPSSSANTTPAEVALRGARSALHAGNFDLAERDARKAVEEGGGVPALSALAEAYEGRGDTESARRTWQRVLAIDPTHAQAREKLSTPAN